MLQSNAPVGRLARVVTADGLRLDGMLHTPDGHASSGWLLVCIHGAGGNFYASAPFEGLTPLLTRAGYAVLRINTRGHGLVSTLRTAHGPVRQGAAYEVVDACRLDLAAWVHAAREAGFSRLALVGHSLGAIKAVYYLSHEPSSPVDALVAISPPRLSYAKFMDSPRKDEFLAQLEKANAAIAQGVPDLLLDVAFPIPLLISAAGFLDKYGPAERYNILQHVHRIACPSLFLYGDLELLEGPAFQNMPEDLRAAGGDHARSIEIEIVAGANHLYAGSLAPLSERIDCWLRALQPPGFTEPDKH